jgi:superoxide dismutase
VKEDGKYLGKKGMKMRWEKHRKRTCKEQNKCFNQTTKTDGINLLHYLLINYD